MSELPVTAETRLLRALGSKRSLGKVAREAAEHDSADDPPDPVGAILLPLLRRLHLLWPDPELAPDAETKELLMETRDIYDVWYEKTLAEGRAEGEARGLIAVLAARGLELTTDQAERVRACRDTALLEAWLRRAATATSTAQVFE